MLLLAVDKLLVRDVISCEFVVILPSAEVTLVVKLDIADALADNPVVPSVIAEFKDVILTDVDILVAPATPATKSMLSALDSIASSFASICDCNVVSTEDAAPEDVVDQEDPV
jgi:predicted nucleic acid-binding protein